MDKQAKKAFIKKLIWSGIGIALLLGGLYLLFYLLGWTKLTREEIQAYVASKGALAPLIFILITVLQVTVVPIPGAVTIIAGSYLFGAGYSFLYSYIGMLVGSMLSFALGKLLGRPFVNWLAGGGEVVDGWVKKLKGRENVLLFFMFLFPAFPDDILCAVAGLFPLSWLGFTVMQLVTRATSIAGTLLFMSGEFIPFHGWGLVVLALVASLFIVAFVLCMKYTEKINAWFYGMVDKLAAKRKLGGDNSQPAIEEQRDDSNNCGRAKDD